MAMFLRDVGDNSQGMCANISPLSNLEDSLIESPDYPSIESLDSIACCVKLVGIRRCRTVECVKREERIRQGNIIPACEWTPFRDWALQVVACHDWRGVNDSRSGSAVELCRLIHRELAMPSFLDGQAVHQDVFGIWQVARWAGGRYTFDDLSSWDFFRDTTFGRPVILDVLDKISDLGVCQHRLWNFVSASQKGLVELPEICALLRMHIEIRHDKHTDCTADLCLLDDNNTTAVQQLHKCEYEEACNEKGSVFFDPERNSRFNDGDTRFVSTAWDFSGNPSSQPFMAISHVWSDGTGVGIKTPGQVNRCLVDFFKEYASKQGLQAVWWDTISIPSATERKQKARALEQMHQNYSKAAFTLVHDKQLTEMDWADDGSPCVALVLSAWFSRGWTALELQHSRKVKVLFRNPHAKKDPNADRLVMKDLKDDILAVEGNLSTHLAHRAASIVIEMIFGKPNRTSSLAEVIKTLRSRYTSWPRDRLIIASLMLHIKGFKSTWIKTKMSQEIIMQRGPLATASLLHGRVTMRTRGAWSWCPISVLDFGDPEQPGALEVQLNGEIRGKCWVIPVHSVKDISPLEGSHQSVALRINLCLRSPNKCLLFDPISDGGNDRKRFLLVLNLGVQHEIYNLCQYVGVVTGLSSAWGTHKFVCLGSEHDIPFTPDAIDRLPTPNEQQLFGPWSGAVTEA